MGRGTAIGLGLVALTLVVLLLLGVFEREPESSDPPQAAGASGQEPALRADGTIDPASVQTPTAEGTTPEEPLSNARYTLRGRVTGPDGSPAPGTSIRVTAAVVSYKDIEVEIDARTAEDGTYEVGVGALFDVEDELPLMLIVHAEHPRFMRGSARLPVTGRDRTGDGREYAADIQLRSAAVLTGQLVHADGAPVTNGWVRILRLIDGTVRQPEGMQESTPTDSSGRFRIAHSEDDADMVLFANAPHLLPSTRTVQLHMDRTTELDPIVLGRGHAITGWLRVRGAPLAGMQLRCQRHWRDGSKSVIVGRRSSAVLWKDGSVTPQEKATTTDSDGRFELTGLTAHEWHVRLHHGASTSVHWDLIREHLKPKFTAPAKDVVIDLDGVLVTLRIVDEDGAPIPRMGTSTGGFGVPADDMGVTRVLWPANVSKTIRIRRVPEYVTQTVTIETGEVGTDVERTITLQRAKPGPVLEVTLEGEDADRIDIIGVALHQSGSRRYPQHSATVRRMDGVFRFTRAVPGAFEVEVRPDSTYRGGSGHYLPARQLVLIPEAGTEHVTVKLKRGGRLAIEVRGPDGRLIGARAKLTDADGRPLRAFFWGRGGVTGSGSSGRLGSIAPTMIDPALPAGTYHIHLTYRGFQDLTLTGDVVLGETTTLTGTMLRSK